jgi:hypothetical protein
MRISIILIFALLLSCDSASNLELPEDNYFLKYFGNDGNQKGVDVEVDSEGNFYLLGSTDSLGGNTEGKERQIILIKTDAKGDLIWQKYFGTSNVDNARDLLLTTDNKLAVLANSAPSFETTSVSSDIYIAILNTNGDILQTKIVGLANSNEVGYSISQTNDGFIVAGSTTAVEAKGSSLVDTDLTDGLQIRFYSNLAIDYPNWRQKLGSEFSDVIVNLTQSENGEFSLFGYSNKKLPFTTTTTTRNNYNYWVRAVNSSGNPTREETYVTDNSTDFVLNSVVKTDEGFLLVGQSVVNSGSRLYVSKLSKNLTGAKNFITPQQGELGTSISVENYGAPNSSIASFNSEIYVFSNESFKLNNANWYFDKLNIDGGSSLKEPILFGGEFDDKIGAIKVLKDGKIVMIGTMAIGTRGSEQKMTLIKVNSSGKFAR